MYVQQRWKSIKLFFFWKIGVVRIIWEIDATDITYVHRHMIFILNGLYGETIFQCLMYMLIVNDKLVRIVLSDVGLGRIFLFWMVWGHLGISSCPGSCVILSDIPQIIFLDIFLSYMWNILLYIGSIHMPLYSKHPLKQIPKYSL